MTATGTLHNPPQHGELEVARVDRRPRPIAPQFLARIASPFPVVVDPLGDVLFARKPAEHEVVQHRIMQHHHPRRLERALIDLLMQAIIAKMIQMNVCRRRAAFDRTHRCSARLSVSA